MNGGGSVGNHTACCRGVFVFTIGWAASLAVHGAGKNIPIAAAVQYFCFARRKVFHVCFLREEFDIAATTGPIWRD